MFKKLGTALLITSLAASASSAAYAAAPPVSKQVGYDLTLADGRNVNGIGTARFTDITMERKENGTSYSTFYYGKKAVVQGKVTIDGPAPTLKVTVNGVRAAVSPVVNQDKTYTFIAELPTNNHGANSVDVYAATYYQNGVKAGMIHSDGHSVSSITVLPVVTAIQLAEEQTVWSYDRSANTFALGYAVVKQLSNGKSEGPISLREASIPGLQTEFTANVIDDRTGAVDAEKQFAFEVPVAVRGFSASPITRDSFSFDQNTRTYTLQFSLTKELSRGDAVSSGVTVPNLTPGSISSYTASDNKYHSYSVVIPFSVPDAPEASTPEYAVSTKSEYAGDSSTVKVTYEYRGITGVAVFTKDSKMDKAVTLADGTVVYVRYLAPTGSTSSDHSSAEGNHSNQK